MSELEAVVFDCFGVLYPEFTVSLYERYRDRLGGSPALIDELNAQIDLGLIDRARFFEVLEGRVRVPAAVLQAEVDRQLQPDLGLVETIERLRDRYKIGLLSNAGEEEIAIIFRDGLDALFDAMTVSYEVGVAKPNPEIFQVSATRLDVNLAESLFVDDLVENLSAAAELGMQTLHYPCFGSQPQVLRTLLDQER